MTYGVSNGNVTDDVTSPQNVLWGSTVGYPSDSLASCIRFAPSNRLFVSNRFISTADRHCIRQTFMHILLFDF